MSVNVVTNKRGTSSKVVLRVSANSSIQVANLAYDSSENISAAGITRLYWSATQTSGTSSPIKITRDGVDIVTLSGSGSWDLNGIKLSENNTANLEFTVVGGTLIVELSKVSDFDEVFP